MKNNVVIRWFLAASVFVLFLVQVCSAEKVVENTVGKVSEVIVYRGQALVTREIEVDLAEGGLELIVGELPNRIVSESLFAQGPEGVVISSVRYRERAVQEDTREEVKQLEAEIEGLTDQHRHIKAQQEVINRNLDTVSKLENFAVTAQSSDLNRGVLQFEPLEKLVGYIQKKRGEYHKEFMTLDDEAKGIEKQLELLQRKRQELRAGRSRTEREAVLFVKSERKKRGIINLSYLVNEASWLPQYNLRAEPDESKVAVEYNSIIYQASGEDWEDVSLSLSTAQATMAAGSPSIEPLEVRLGQAVAKRKARDLKRSGAPAFAPQEDSYRDLGGRFRDIQSSRLQMAQKGKAANVELNRAAVQNQMMEFEADKEAVAVIKKEARAFARREGVSVTYDLGEGLTMPSRSDQQLITIASFEAKADFLMTATPLLTDYVYLQAEVTNDSDVIMLAGPASMYRNGEFVGKGQMEMVTMGEKFTTGFGVESQVRISREFKDKKVDTLWGNKVEEYEYRLAIENYKNSNVKLRLLERMPYTEDEGLEITGFKTNTPLSKDAEYLRGQREKGILRWDLELKGGTVETKATIVTYGYTMKYDNELAVQPVSVYR